MNAVDAVLDLGTLRMIDTRDGLHFFKDTDVPLLYLDAEAKHKLCRYLTDHPVDAPFHPAKGVK